MAKSLTTTQTPAPLGTLDRTIELLGYDPTKTAAPVIAADTLIKQEKPVIIPQKVKTAQDNLSMKFSSLGTNSEPDPVNQDENGQFKDLISQLSSEPGYALKQQEKAGLFDARKELGEINKNIKQLDANYFDQVKRIEANKEGKFGGAVQQDLNTAQSTYNDEKYKLAVRKSVVNEDINTALEISKAYVDAKYEPIKLQIQALKDYREFASNDLTESESKRLDQIISQQNAAYESKLSRETTFEQGKVALLSSASQQGAPASVRTAIQNATTLEEAINAAGEWGGDVLARRLKQAELDSKIAAIAKIKGEVVPTDVMGLTDKVASLEAIKTHPALNDLVGNSPLTRIGLTTNAQSFRADVYNLASKETLDFLVNLKAKGGTLGALNIEELRILRDSATKLNTWEIKDENGIGTGFWNVKESDFLAEIDRIEELTNRALTKALGYDPTLVSEEDVLAVQQATGEGQEEVNPENYY